MTAGVSGVKMGSGARGVSCRRCPLELYVDGQPRQAAQDRPLGEALELLRREAAGAGRAIVTVHLDGRELSPQEEEKLLTEPASALGRVEVQCAPAAEWGRHGLGEVASALGQLGDSFRSSAEAFRSNRIGDGLNQANAAVASYAQVVQALVSSVALSGVAPDPGLKAAIDGVVNVVRELEKSARASDGVASADLVEYELPERLEALAKLVRGMAETAR